MGAKYVLTYIPTHFMVFLDTFFFMYVVFFFVRDHTDSRCIYTQYSISVSGI